MVATYLIDSGGNQCNTNNTPIVEAFAAVTEKKKSIRVPCVRLQIYKYSKKKGNAKKRNVNIVKTPKMN